MLLKCTAFISANKNENKVKKKKIIIKSLTDSRIERGTIALKYDSITSVKSDVPLTENPKQI